MRGPLSASIHTAVITTLFTLLALFSAGTQAQGLSDQTISSFIDSLKAAEQLEPEFEDLSEDMDSLSKLHITFKLTNSNRRTISEVLCYQ